MKPHVKKTRAIARNGNSHVDRMKIDCNYLSHSPFTQTREMFDHEGLVNGHFLSQNNFITTYSYISMVVASTQ